MKKYTGLLFLLYFSFYAKSQILCNPNGNLVLFTNYDGGILNINLDMNIPNLKIGIVSYEAVSVNLSGTFVNNVTAVHYAGYNGSNNNCGSGVTVTSINGAPVSATTSIVFAPSSPLTNSNGNPSIICGYSCSTTTNQGGCNTIDQIEAYFANYFPGSSLRSHKVQYNCWSGSQLVSGGGTCCGNPVLPLSLSVSIVQPLCHNACNGSAIATASGGQSPYLYQWTGGPASSPYTNLCPGIYTVSVTDGAGNSATQVATISNPVAITSSHSQTACFSYTFNGNTLTSSGTYKDTLLSAAGCDSVVTLNLTINTVNVSLNQNVGTLTSAATGAVYKWFNCSTNTLIPSATSQSFMPTANGDYAVIVTQNGCTDTSVCKTVVVSGVKEAQENQLVSIYPNPVENEVFIKVDASLLGRECAIITGNGHVLLKQALQSVDTKFNLHSFAKGIYFITIEGIGTKYKIQK